MRRVNDRGKVVTASLKIGVDECADDEPLTRIHTEDLCGALRRMLAMFDIVDTHGADSSMRGTASMDASISRLPTGSVLEVVDDGPADSMVDAELWAKAMMGAPLNEACARLLLVNASDARPPKARTGHRADATRNTRLKKALGMPEFMYKDYRHGAAKIFGVPALAREELRSMH